MHACMQAGRQAGRLLPDLGGEWHAPAVSPIAAYLSCCLISCWRPAGPAAELWCHRRAASCCCHGPSDQQHSVQHEPEQRSPQQHVALLLQLRQVPAAAEVQKHSNNYHTYSDGIACVLRLHPTHPQSGASCWFNRTSARCAGAAAAAPPGAIISPHHGLCHPQPDCCQLRLRSSHQLHRKLEGRSVFLPHPVHLHVGPAQRDQGARPAAAARAAARAASAPWPHAEHVAFAGAACHAGTPGGRRPTAQPCCTGICTGAPHWVVMLPEEPPPTAAAGPPDPHAPGALLPPEPWPAGPEPPEPARWHRPR